MAVTQSMTATATAPVTVKLSSVVNTFRPSKLFKLADSSAHFTSLDYSDNGDFLITADESEQLGLYNVRDGIFKQPFYSKKYGCHLAKFTHANGHVLYASTKGDDALRYLDLHKGAYQRYFPGHTGHVTSLQINPGNDTFISSSMDNTVRLWALNTPNATGVMNLTGPYLTAYDATASVIAIASPAASSILLYDLRHFDRAPFAMFDLRSQENALSPNSIARWTNLEFSNDGKHLLVGAAGDGHYVLDAFDGKLTSFLHRPSGKPTALLAAGQAAARGKAASSGDCCFSPDGRYVISGTGAANVLIWDIAGGTSTPEAAGSATTSVAAAAEKAKDIVKTPILELEHASSASVVKWNPRFGMFATAGKECIFWVPDDHAAMDVE